jgi:hypothetical protein
MEPEELLLGEATNEQLVREMVNRPGLVAVVVLSTVEALKKAELSSMPFQVVKCEGIDYQQATVLLASGAASLAGLHLKPSP